MKASKLIKILSENPDLEVKVQVRSKYMGGVKQGKITGVLTSHDGTKPKEEMEVPEYIIIETTT